MKLFSSSVYATEILAEVLGPNLFCLLLDDLIFKEEMLNEPDC